ncbi:phosphohydrolase [Streptomyces sp. NPDC006475]|uniref:phosphohydrolase n=1 Tax=Streptomyces sp. NPDC006475 TaxID=3155719 RepID=UPI0033A218D8
MKHVQAVVGGARELGGSREQIAAAWLHDTLENDVLTREWLDSAELPQAVKALVDAMAERPGESVESYTRRILTTNGAFLIKDADLAHNADPQRLALLDEPTRKRTTQREAHDAARAARPDSRITPTVRLALRRTRGRR